MSYKEKQVLYREGKYQFTPPPVPHHLWCERDWIIYIDNCGRWITSEKENPCHN